MIPFNDLRPTIAPIRADIDAAIRRVIDRGVFLNGPEVDAFEEEWAKYCGASHCIACASGTDAITLMCGYLAQTHKAGVSVTVQANTLPCTAIGVERSGIGVFIDDCTPDGRCDYHRLNTMPVLLYGRYPVGLENECTMFDACQAHGWKLPQNAMASMSFYPTKNDGTFDDAGCVVTQSEEVAKVIRKIQDVSTYRSGLQFHSRMSEIDAAVLRVKLPLLDEWNAERERLASVYYENLPTSVEPVTKPGEQTNHHLFAVLSERRDELDQHLAENGITCVVHYRKPLSIKCPNALRWCNRVLSLPMFVGMTPEQVRTVCDVIRWFE